MSDFDIGWNAATEFVARKIEDHADDIIDTAERARLHRLANDVRDMTSETTD